MHGEQDALGAVAGRPRTRARVAYAAVGAALLVGELLAAAGRPPLPGAQPGAHQALAVVLALSVGLARWRPALALGLLVVTSVGQVVVGTDLTLDTVALAVVSFHCARRGTTATLWLSGAYVPAASLVGGFYAIAPGSTIVAPGEPAGPAGELLASVLGWTIALAPLFVPWLLGLALRMRDRAEESQRLQLRAEAERSVALARQAQAEALARAEEQRARLARDVHDVVGHSLAVILAQAQSADYLAERPSPQVLAILHAVAESARASLHEVRSLLVPAPEHGEAPHRLDDVLDLVPEPPGGLRRHVHGTPRPLEPETSVVVRRVLQEMITNALKHGDPEEGMDVTIEWGTTFTLTVRNTVRARAGARTAPGAVRPDGGDDGASATGGFGLEGMRRRLESVGGRLAVEEDGQLFRVTATVPLAGALAGAEPPA